MRLKKTAPDPSLSSPMDDKLAALEKELERIRRILASQERVKASEARFLGLRKASKR